MIYYDLHFLFINLFPIILLYLFNQEKLIYPILSKKNE